MTAEEVAARFGAYLKARDNNHRPAKVNLLRQRAEGALRHWMLEQPKGWEDRFSTHVEVVSESAVRKEIVSQR